MTTLSRQELFEKVWAAPVTKVAAELGLSDNGLRKICGRHDIPVPSRGYWAQVQAGGVFPRPRLRPVQHSSLKHITVVGARLMLALAESRAIAEGLDWVFCDTDSLALMRSDGMASEEFEAAAERVIEWFRPLDPYDCGSSILKAERANYAADDGKVREPLFCLAISSKRYVLFNIGPDGKPQIRKGSAHGLGHLRAPYGADDPAPSTPANVPIGEIELPRWQHDLG